MEWQVIVALVVTIPIVLFPVAFVWYLNAGGILILIKEAREKQRARKRAEKIPSEIDIK